MVDAGGRGFTLLLDALLEVTDGRPIPEPDVVDDAGRRSRRTCAGDDVAGLRYEVMYLLDAPDATIAGFKDAWGAIGDSIVVVGGDGLWNCHVHTNDIGAAIEAGIEAGRPRNVRVTDLFEQVEQVEEEQWVREAGVVDVDVATPAVDDRGRRGRRRRRRAPPAQEPRRAAPRRGRAVDEPVDGADPRSGRGVQRRRRSSCCRTTRTSCRSRARSTRSPSKQVAVVRDHERARSARRARRLRPERRLDASNDAAMSGGRRRACAPAR